MVRDRGSDPVPEVVVKSAHLVVANGMCDLCGAEAVGTLDWDADEKTFFCAACARMEYEEAKSKEEAAARTLADVPYTC
jgi:hypothetical protein